MTPSVTNAQSAESDAAAEALFREGRRLLEAGEYESACEKFEASYELDVALGTLLNLARCFELAQRNASAWARYVEAATRARREGEVEREQYARQRAAALEPMLTRLVVRVPTRVAGMTVTVDGRPFPRPTWGTPIPVDSRELTIRASADGYHDWEGTVDASQEAATVEVEIPALEPLPPPEVPDVPVARPVAPPPPPPEEPPLLTGGQIGGIIVAGLGLGTAVGGIVVGTNAKSLWDDANCMRVDSGELLCPSADALSDANDANSQATQSTVLVIAGGAMVATGAVLVAVLRRADDEDGEAEGDSARRVRVDLSPAVSTEGAGLVVRGSF